MASFWGPNLVVSPILCLLKYSLDWIAIMSARVQGRSSWVKRTGASREEQCTHVRPWVCNPGMLQLALTGYPAQMCICGMAYRKYLVYPYLCIRRTYRRGRTLRHPWSACINNQAQGTASGLLALPGNACSAGMGLTLRLEAKRRCLRAKLDEVKKWHNCASCICSLQSRVASP